MIIRLQKKETHINNNNIIILLLLSAANGLYKSKEVPHVYYQAPRSSFGQQ